MKKHSPEELEAIYQKHVGHVIRYYWDGHAQNNAKVLRVAYTNVHGYDSVRLWLDVGEKFPLMIYDSNVKGCECQK